MDVDVAFYGDSITYGGQWQQYFPDVQAVNLGYAGDGLSGMIDRISQVYSVQPEKVFILAGINGLKENGVAHSINYYEQIIEGIKCNLKNCNIYIQSVLPISSSVEERYGTNELIQEYNEALMELADRQSIEYVDLWSLYEINGQMNPEYTTDGVHLKAEAYNYWIKKIEPYVCDK